MPRYGKIKQIQCVILKCGNLHRYALTLRAHSFIVDFQDVVRDVVDLGV